MAVFVGRSFPSWLTALWVQDKPTAALSDTAAGIEHARASVMGGEQKLRGE
jgi:hypothetical protein